MGLGKWGIVDSAPSSRSAWTDVVTTKGLLDGVGGHLRPAGWILRPVSEADAPRFVVPVGAFGVTGAAEHADALAALGRMAEGEGSDRLPSPKPAAVMTRPAAA